MASWTTVEDLVGVLRQRWERGRYLSDHAQGRPWVPIELPVRGPSSRDLLERFSEVDEWSRRFERGSRTRAGAPRFEVVYRTIGGRHLGSNAVPARICVGSFEQLCALTGTSRQVRDLDSILLQTEAALPALVEWVAAHPLRALEHQESWPDLLGAVTWISAHASHRLFLRQIDVDGVDTKFVDRHRRLLDELLTVVLPAERVDERFTPATSGGFARRFGFRDKPAYTRFRPLDDEQALPSGVTELIVRTRELASLELVSDTVFVVENEISYLAFPVVPGAVVVFGSGFALGTLAETPWLEARKIVYWGDVDTHGFDILHRMRTQFASVESMLMDEATLLAHRRQWVREPSPTSRPLSNLTPEEEAVYHGLVEDRYGPAVRLEQERVRFSLLEQALEPFRRAALARGECGEGISSAPDL